ncbi:SRPBCC family protein [Naumannella halotolerans]|uniref:Polyketide cyclase/dehydrase/lipid transport protein n=1 Tax=Naumannella halotolerans TaxID=993414 RepID=A0A4R7J6B4_9ACTN|nr:SRPBCC family protein [Naumannella halotolerans]TDT32921.1 polyketide cyclase/dehydrase/lipid transport protein [Naumannella halotolerans]
MPAIEQNDQVMVRSRVVPTDPTTVFALLRNPRQHQYTEPGDWVRDAIDPQPLKEVDQVFGMNMAFPGSGQPYVMHNRVTRFELDQSIEWEPGQLNEAGEFERGGWFWRYDLAPVAEGTEVTLTYDWTATPQAFRDEVGGLPAFGPEFLDASLAALEKALESEA